MKSTQTVTHTSGETVLNHWQKQINTCAIPRDDTRCAWTYIILLSLSAI